MQIVKQYFNDLSEIQLRQLESLESIYSFWNSKINLISRNDIKYFYKKHVLHSLSIAKVIKFKKNSNVLDVGTGGGFPGVPLAIIFPQTKFYLIDSIGKKTKVVKNIINSINLTNVEVHNINVKNFKNKVDFVVSRAVTAMDNFVPLVRNNIGPINNHKIKNGILYLKGGNLRDELKNFKNAKQYKIVRFFNDPFFESKKVVYLPL